MADQKFDLPFYQRFLKQKGGIANMVMAAFTCVLSMRAMQQRDEWKGEKARMEASFAVERRELVAEIDALKNRGWFGFRGGSGAGKSGSKQSGVAGSGGGGGASGGEAAGGGKGAGAAPQNGGKGKGKVLI